ncbi:hypothetical protein HY945_01740 [Candidatus Gottesmanbacteria bacterium]|nr:hypothetical protein [Candidatus Gottesmanbacteria bacterium]
MKFTFGSKELVRCLFNLGFTPRKQLGTSHQKFIPPYKKIPYNPSQRSFMIVQQGQKEYDPHARTRYIRQIMNFGFSEEEILKAFRKN